MALIPKMIEHIKRNKVLPTFDIGPVANVNGTQLFLQNRQGSNGRNVLFAKVLLTSRTSSTEYVGTVYLNGPASTGVTSQKVYLLSADGGTSLVGDVFIAVQMAHTISGNTEIHWTIAGSTSGDRYVAVNSSDAPNYLENQLSSAGNVTPTTIDVGGDKQIRFDSENDGGSGNGGVGNTYIVMSDSASYDELLDDSLDYRCRLVEAWITEPPAAQSATPTTGNVFVGHSPGSDVDLVAEGVYTAYVDYETGALRVRGSAASSAYAIIWIRHSASLCPENLCRCDPWPPASWPCNGLAQTYSAAIQYDVRHQGDDLLFFENTDLAAVSMTAYAGEACTYISAHTGARTFYKLEPDGDPCETSGDAGVYYVLTFSSDDNRWELYESEVGASIPTSGPASKGLLLGWNDDPDGPDQGTWAENTPPATNTIDSAGTGCGWADNNMYVDIATPSIT